MMICNRNGHLAPSPQPSPPKRGRGEGEGVLADSLEKVDLRIIGELR